jgi:predicted metal-dependent enzyme (double-stranded beta helix superfamily)
MYTLDAYVADLRRITAATTDYGEIFDQVAPLAIRLALAKDSWLTPELYETDAEQGFGAHLLHVEPDNSLAVFGIAWAPGNGTPAHDHGTWAVVAGVEGIERNIKYNRLDDRSKPAYAELQERNTLNADAGDVICLKPRGIHLVWNDSDEVTLSLHTYGHHFNYTQRSQFDLESNVATPFVVNVR